MDNPENHLQAKIGQYVLITNDKNKILLLQRSRSKKWSLPGGRLDKNDSNPELALQREIKEETSLEVTKFQPFTVKLIKDEWQIKYCVYFSAYYDGITSIQTSEEHCSIKWVSDNDIQGLILDEEPELREVISLFFDKQQ